MEAFPLNISHSEKIFTHLSQCESNDNFIYIYCLYFKLWTSLFKSEKRPNKHWLSRMRHSKCRGSGKYCHCSHKSSSPDSTVSHQTIKKRDSFIHWSSSGAAQSTTHRILCLLIGCHVLFDWKQSEWKRIHFCINSTLCLSIVTDLVKADIIHPLNKSHIVMMATSLISSSELCSTMYGLCLSAQLCNFLDHLKPKMGKYIKKNILSHASINMNYERYGRYVKDWERFWRFLFAMMNCWFVSEHVLFQAHFVVGGRRSY